MKLSRLRQITLSLPANFDPNDPEQRSQVAQQLGLAPGEIYPELEMDSRFVDTYREDGFADMYMMLHSHHFYEILYCCNDCSAEYFVGAKRYYLQKGDVILIPPGMSHRAVLPERMVQPFDRIVLWINTEFMRSVCGAFPEMRNMQCCESTLLRTANTPWEELGALFHNGVTIAQNYGKEQQMLLVGNTLTLLAKLYCAQMHQGHEKQSEKSELLDRILAYVETHLDQKISLAQVAKHLGVSESVISHTFREKLNVSFYRCVIQRRLIAAKALIAENVLLETVCARVGFSDYATFYRAFRQEFGISPRQYRQLLEQPEKK